MMRPVHGREPAGYRGPTVVLTPAACTAAGAHNGCLRRPINRAATEGLLARTGVVAAAASGLPFRAGSFDVIIHTDVLC